MLINHHQQQYHTFVTARRKKLISSIFFLLFNIKSVVVGLDKWLNFSFKSILILIDCQERKWFESKKRLKEISGRFNAIWWLLEDLKVCLYLSLMWKSWRRNISFPKVFKSQLPFQHRDLSALKGGNQILCFSKSQGSTF